MFLCWLKLIKINLKVEEVKLMKKFMEKFEKFNKEKEPIVDVEVDEKELEKYEEFKETLEIVIDSLPEELDPPGETFDKFSLHPASFEEMSNYLEIEDEEKQKQEEEKRKKIVLNLSFKELGFDPKNPELVKEEKIEIKIEDRKEVLTLKYFKTNRPDLVLVFNGFDWWLEKK